MTKIEAMEKDYVKKLKNIVDQKEMEIAKLRSVYSSTPNYEPILKKVKVDTGVQTYLNQSLQ